MIKADERAEILNDGELAKVSGGMNVQIESVTTNVSGGDRALSDKMVKAIVDVVRKTIGRS